MANELISKTKMSEYPEKIEKYFQNKDIVIKIIPEKYKRIVENKCCDIKITSAQQFVNFLKKEEMFWAKVKSNGNDFLGCLDKVTSSLNSINSAVRNLNGNYEYCLNDAVGKVQQNFLYSETDLAKFLLKLENKSAHFFQGFDFALQGNNLVIHSSYSEVFEGFVVGLEYIGELKKTRELYGNCAEEFAENIKVANDNFAELNNRYIIACQDQEHRIADLQEKTDNGMKHLKEDSEKFLKDRQAAFEHDEKLYKDVLKFSKPANYWADMSKSYAKKGRNWLIASCFVALLIIAMLVLIITLVPNIVGEKTHWFDIIKNSAIITVIASVAIYILRTFIKMAMSSLHLSRDAKEREQLSYFYLALRNENAVSDNEQALVINSLFSRADTGLLKGDSAPSMSANVTDVVEKLKN